MKPLAAKHAFYPLIDLSVSYFKAKTHLQPTVHLSTSKWINFHVHLFSRPSISSTIAVFHLGWDGAQDTHDDVFPKDNRNIRALYAGGKVWYETKFQIGYLVAQEQDPLHNAIGRSRA